LGWIISALVAFGSFLGFMHALVAVASLSCIRSAPGLNLVSPEADLLIIVTCLVLAWILGFFQRGVFAFRFFGTRFYGREETNQGYITTKWLVAGFPIIPIRSYIVVYQVEDIWKYEVEYQQSIMYPIAGYFDWSQMLRTAAVSYGTIVWCLGCVWLMFLDPCI